MGRQRYGKQRAGCRRGKEEKNECWCPGAFSVTVATTATTTTALLLSGSKLCWAERFCGAHAFPSPPLPSGVPWRPMAHTEERSPLGRSEAQGQATERKGEPRRGRERGGD
ncbi:hypothetical protein GQ54DRAFT_93285 [Martensiomyces pterosporus]|nr:hypothetical protein GQ54DRAFT_93285 [Martensiomyces pterosporus]